MFSWKLRPRSVITWLLRPYAGHSNLFSCKIDENVSHEGGGAAHILIAINSFSPSFEELSLATTFPLRKSPLQFRMNQGSSVSFDLEFASYDNILHPFKRKVKVIFHL